MHTLKILVGGVVVLLVCLTVGKMSSSPRGLASAALIFIPIWFVGASLNMYFGVKKAGYSIADEVPVFYLVFAIPVVGAVGVWLSQNK